MTPHGSLLLAVLVASAADSGAPHDPGATFVHLFEWSWPDVALECEQWLGPKGFKAVQVSPPNEHIQREEWWARYQPVTYNLTSRSGKEADFANMVHRCHRAGVAVYIDAVINHVATATGRGVAGSWYGNRATPIFSPLDMHHGSDLRHNCGISDYRDAWMVQSCDLVGLPDLCTSCPHVQKTLAAYINRVASLGVAGIRIDAAKHMKSSELAKLLSQTNASLFRFSEVIGNFAEPIKASEYLRIGSVTEFEYPRALLPHFAMGGKLSDLRTFGSSGFVPSESAVTFLDNHDTQRGEAQLTHRDGPLYELANIFMLAHPYGYPKVMSSYFFSSFDQGPPKSPVHGESVACSGGSSERRTDAAPWVCEHRWTAIANMVGWRQSAGRSPVELFEASGDDTIAFCRGKAACVALNKNPLASWEVTLNFSLPVGDYCDIIRSDDLSKCENVSVKRGATTLRVPPLSAVALHVGKRIFV